MNTSTKKSTKKHAEFLLYGEKDVHLQPKIVINNNNSTEMKRIIFSVLAIGLSVGVMAQTKSESEISRSAKKFNVQTPKASIYTQFDESCATIDSMTVYQAQYEGEFAGFVTGQNIYDDQKYAEVYDFGQSLQITGIQAFIANAVQSPISQNIPIQLMSADFSSVLAEGSVNATDLVDGEFTVVTFQTPVSASSVACAVETGLLNIQSEGDPYNLLYVTSTAMDCASGENSYSYSMVDQEGNYEWVTILSQYNKDMDLFIFPIVEGAAGLSDVELNSLSYVYPNPAKSEVMLASSLSINKVEIVNVLGQLVFASDVNANSIKVNTSDFAAGNYIVKMYTAAGVATKKLVVE